MLKATKDADNNRCLLAVLATTARGEHPAKIMKLNQQNSVNPDQIPPWTTSQVTPKMNEDCFYKNCFIMNEKKIILATTWDMAVVDLELNVLVEARDIREIHSSIVPWGGLFHCSRSHYTSISIFFSFWMDDTFQSEFKTKQPDKVYSGINHK